MPQDRDHWVCHKCRQVYYEMYYAPKEGQKKDDRMYSDTVLERENFSKISFRIATGLEALIEIDFIIPTKAKVRLFFGKEGSESIYSRDYLESSKNNFVHIKIMPSKKQSSTQWIKKGTHDVGDNFESGYTIEVFLRDADSELRKFLVNILNSRGFGCLPTARTIYAHLNDDNPNEDKAKEILKNIVDEIASISKNS
ncbi:MAG TPA: hypothetical protein VD731_07365 [Nitrosopumilaceae archaeon]|nr:hypothetical protein [Nitrosopumilaceae archaeon]